MKRFQAVYRSLVSNGRRNPFRKPHSRRKPLVLLGLFCVSFLLVTLISISAFAAEITRTNPFGLRGKQEWSQKGLILPEERSPLWKDPSFRITLNKLKQVGFIVPHTTPLGTVVANFDGVAALSTGDIIFIDFGKQQGVKRGDWFTVFSKRRFIYHPVLEQDTPIDPDLIVLQNNPGNSRIDHQETEVIPYFDGQRSIITVEDLQKEELILEDVDPPAYKRPKGLQHRQILASGGRPLGYLIRVMGFIQIIEAGEGQSKALIQESYYDITNGDLVVPFKPPQFPKTHFKGKDERRIEGYAVAFKHDFYIAGQSDIVYIDRGWAQGVLPGDLFEAYKITYKVENILDVYEAKEPMLPQVIAKLQVVDVQRNTATLATLSSFRQMELGQPVRLVRRAPPPPPVVVRRSPPPVAPPPKEPPPPPKELPKELVNVYFDFDKFNLDEKDQKILSKHAQFMNENPEVHLEIQGHCDEHGTNNYNLSLGNRRANAVKEYLVSVGIDETRLSTLSFGEEQPVCTEKTRECWKKNRRTHFKVQPMNLEDKPAPDVSSLEFMEDASAENINEETILWEETVQQDSSPSPARTTTVSQVQEIELFRAQP